MTCSSLPPTDPPADGSGVEPSAQNSHLAARAQQITQANTGTGTSSSATYPKPSQQDAAAAITGNSAETATTSDAPATATASFSPNRDEHNRDDRNLDATIAPLTPADVFANLRTSPPLPPLEDYVRRPSDTWKQSFRIAPAPPPTLLDFRRALFSTRHLLLGRTARDRLWGWLGPGLVTLLALALRVWNLGYPHKLVFDETHYVKQAWTLLQVGYETTWPDDYDPKFEADELGGYNTSPSFIVHPQLGKWLISLGMRLLGADNAWGWRIMVCLAGTATVWILARAARRLLGSTKLGVLAGFLYAIDGQGIVGSRYALLDGFLAFFIVAAFATFLVDRDEGRHRLAERAAARIEAGKELKNWGPFLGMRWWRLATGILLGLACAVKWSGLYVLAAWGIAMVIDDALARKAIGIKGWLLGGIFKDGLFAFLLTVPTAFAVYLATWFSWFTHSASWGRMWAVEHPGQGVTWLPEALRSLLHFHQEMLTSATNLVYAHPYGAHPAGWLIQLHPTVYWRGTLTGNEATCGAEQCIATIVGVGNPVLWWGATAALVWLVVVWYDRLDWRFGLIVTAIGATWLPWFLYAKRVVFTFYSIAFAPFVVLLFVYAVAQVVERWDLYRATTQRRMRLGGVMLFLAIIATSVFFYPVWTGIPQTPWLWFWHSWMPGWM